MLRHCSRKVVAESLRRFHYESGGGGNTCRRLGGGGSATAAAMRCTEKDSERAREGDAPTVGEADGADEAPPRLSEARAITGD